MPRPEQEQRPGQRIGEEQRVEDRQAKDLAPQPGAERVRGGHGEPQRHQRKREGPRRHDPAEEVDPAAGPDPPELRPRHDQPWQRLQGQEPVGVHRFDRVDQREAAGEQHIHQKRGPGGGRALGHGALEPPLGRQQAARPHHRGDGAREGRKHRQGRREACPDEARIDDQPVADGRHAGLQEPAHLDEPQPPVEPGPGNDQHRQRERQRRRIEEKEEREGYRRERREDRPGHRPAILEPRPAHREPGHEGRDRHHMQRPGQRAEHQPRRPAELEEGRGDRRRQHRPEGQRTADGSEGAPREGHRHDGGQCQKRRGRGGRRGLGRAASEREARELRRHPEVRPEPQEEGRRRQQRQIADPRRPQAEDDEAHGQRGERPEGPEALDRVPEREGSRCHHAERQPDRDREARPRVGPAREENRRQPLARRGCGMFRHRRPARHHDGEQDEGPERQRPAALPRAAQIHEEGPPGADRQRQHRHPTPEAEGIDREAEERHEEVIGIERGRCPLPARDEERRSPRPDQPHGGEERPVPPAQQHRPERGGHQPHQRQFRTVETVEEPPRDDPAVDRDEPRGREGRGQQKRRRLSPSPPRRRIHSPAATSAPPKPTAAATRSAGGRSPCSIPYCTKKIPASASDTAERVKAQLLRSQERQRRNPPGPFGPCPVGRRQIAGGRPRQAGFGPSGLARLSRLGQRRHGRTPGADPGPHGLDHVGRRPLGLRQRLCARRLGRSRSRSRQSRLERCLELRHPGREAALAQGQNQRRDGRGQQDSG